MNALTAPAPTTALDLSALTDSQLADLASFPMSPEQWDRLEDEMARRVSAGSDEWSFDLDGAITVS